jgi:uncharacterized coiled-coil protein SlyX
MGLGDEDLRGMDPGTAKEYVFHFITALKLAEKKLAEQEAACAKWQNRAALARDKAAPDLAAEADAEAERIKTQIRALDAEIAELRGKIEKMRRQLPGLAARERSIDPDLLEQELLIALGRGAGEEGPGSPGGMPQTEKALAEIDAQAALDALKRRMGFGGGTGGDTGGDAGGDAGGGTAP